MKKNWQNKIGSGTRKDQEISVATNFGSGTRKRFWESARDIKKIDGEKFTGQRKRERRSSAVAAGGAMDAALEHFWWPWPSEVCVREKGRESVSGIERMDRDMDRIEVFMYIFSTIGRGR
jgi:hypothetical protein